MSAPRQENRGAAADAAGDADDLPEDADRGEPTGEERQPPEAALRASAGPAPAPEPATTSCIPSFPVPVLYCSEYFSINSLLHKQLCKLLRQRTQPMLRPVRDVLMQYQSLPEQRMRAVLHRVRLQPPVIAQALPCRTQQSNELKELRRIMRRRMHAPVRKQQAWLNSVPRGHYACYGITGNSRSIDRFRTAVLRAWRYVLMRRGNELLSNLVYGWLFMRRLCGPRGPRCRR